MYQVPFNVMRIHQHQWESERRNMHQFHYQLHERNVGMVTIFESHSVTVCVCLFHCL